ncbi:MAG: flagellar basal body rod protein FlgC [Pseudomonadales bacterium]|nr:flagellar basal body rod protein FlgC [Pseudomonadales bacterium]
MSLGNIFDIAGTGMSAQTVRLNTTASNLANAETAAGSEDEAYRARYPVFSAVQAKINAAQFAGDSFDGSEGKIGVHVKGIVESDKPLQARYEPEHPLADEEGYVFYPNVNVVEEMTNMISASRTFQANVDVMNATKTMMQRVLTLGQ